MLELMIAVLYQPELTNDYITVKAPSAVCALGGNSYVMTNEKEVTISGWGSFGEKKIKLHDGDYIKLEMNRGIFVSDFKYTRTAPISLEGMNGCD